MFVQRGEQAAYLEDTSNWGGFPVGTNGNCVPTRWVALQGRNINGMKQEWDVIRNKQNAHWKLFDKNCATTVARVLKAGRGDNHTRAANKQLVWWPTDLIRYARCMGNAVFATS